MERYQRVWGVGRRRAVGDGRRDSWRPGGRRSRAGRGRPQAGLTARQRPTPQTRPKQFHHRPIRTLRK